MLTPQPIRTIETRIVEYSGPQPVRVIETRVIEYIPQPAPVAALPRGYNPELDSPLAGGFLRYVGEPAAVEPKRRRWFR